MPSEEIRATARRTIRDRGVWEEFCHWSELWLIAPKLADRLAACLTTLIPTARRGKSLLGDCFEAAAMEVHGWEQSTSTRVLCADALRAMLARALDAANYEVVLPNGSPWSPNLDGPLAACVAATGGGEVTLRPQTNIGQAREAMHRLLERHVYCAQCTGFLQKSYAQLMQQHGVPRRRLWLVS